MSLYKFTAYVDHLDCFPTCLPVRCSIHHCLAKHLMESNQNSR